MTFDPALRGFATAGGDLGMFVALGGMADVATGPLPPPPPPPAPSTAPLHVIDVVAVVEDGSRRAGHVPHDPRKPLIVRAGEPTRLRVSLVRADGAPVRIVTADGDSLVAVAAATSTSSPWFRRAATQGPSRGVYYVDLLATDTKNLGGARGGWDLAVTVGGVRAVVVAWSQFFVQPAPA